LKLNNVDVEIDYEVLIQEEKVWKKVYETKSKGNDLKTR
jgi:hypothetical protein